MEKEKEQQHRRRPDLPRPSLARHRVLFPLLATVMAIISLYKTQADNTHNHRPRRRRPLVLLLLPTQPTAP